MTGTPVWPEDLRRAAAGIPEAIPPEPPALLHPEDFEGVRAAVEAFARALGRFATLSAPALLQALREARRRGLLPPRAGPAALAPRTAPSRS